MFIFRGTEQRDFDDFPDHSGSISVLGVLDISNRPDLRPDYLYISSFSSVVRYVGNDLVDSTVYDKYDLLRQSMSSYAEISYKTYQTLDSSQIIWLLENMAGSFVMTDTKIFLSDYDDGILADLYFR